MARLKLLNLGRSHKGLWLVGSRDTIPEDALRRMTGGHGSHEGSFKARPGSESDTSINAAHSLTQFDGVRFQGASTILYRAAVSLITGLDGTRLSFLKMPPGAGQADSLFICGGGSVDKVNTAGTASEWGISAPPDGFVAAANTVNSRVINDFEGDNTTQYTASGVDITIGNEATIIQEAARSMSLTLGSDEIEWVTRIVAVNLSIFAGSITSPDEDWIRLWFRVDEPGNLNYLEITFSLGNTNFATDTFSKRIFVQGDIIPESRKSLSDIPGVHEDQAEVVSGTESTIAPAAKERVEIAESVGQTFIPNERNAWVLLEIPKISFKRSGNTANIDWDDVGAHRFTLSTNDEGAVVCYLDLFDLAGGFGLQGRYRYHVTFRNTTTGHRSNANPTSVEVVDVGRSSVALTSLPVSTDSQVDQREIWRTIGGGTLFFLAGTVDDNTTTTFTDDVADFAGLASASGVSVLGTTQLPTDNGKFPDTIDDAIWDGKAVFALDSATGQGGRVRYSPLARPEGDKGFIEVSSDDEPLVRIILWNGIRYAFSDTSLYRIDGSDPYASRKVFGIPGVTSGKKHTVVSTPDGIVWEASGGVRLFDGSRSILISEIQVNPIFTGDSAENLTAFDGIVAEYGRGEYFISDGTQGLGYRLSKTRWRDLGSGFTAIHYEPDVNAFIIGTPDDTEIFEGPGLAYTGSFEVQPPEINLTDKDIPIVKRLLIQASPDGQLITPTIIVDGTEIILPPFTGTGRIKEIEYAIGKRADHFGVRLSSTVTNATPEIHMIDIETYDTE